MPEANNGKWVRLAEDVGLPEALREKIRREQRARYVSGGLTKNGRA